jgi:DNA-binding transcriptional LysR family regulator
MDLKTMEYYVAVVEERSVTRAAERLHMSQPPLTVRLKALEKELGVALLARHGRGVEPTAAGRVFADRARRLLREVQDSAEAARLVGQGVAGTLAVAPGASVAPSLLAGLLGALRSEAPDVAISVSTGTDAAVRDQVSHGEADAGLIHLAPQPADSQDRWRGLETAVVSREPLVVVLRADHPLARHERADVVRLTSETLVVPAAASAPGLYEQLLATWQAAGGSPEHVRETDSIPTALALVEARLGIAIVPAAVTAMVWQGLVALPLLQHRPAVETVIVWRREATSPVLHRFLRIALATPEPDVLSPEHSR